MTRKTTNLIGILVAIVSGTYFFSGYCSSCRDTMGQEFPLETPNQIAVSSDRQQASGILNAGRSVPDTIFLEQSEDTGNRVSRMQNVSNQP